MSIVAANGSETVMGERAFARAKPDAAPAKPKASQPAPPTSHHELLARLVGDWDCAISATKPDVKAPMRSRGRMREDLGGAGWWLRSTFRSEIDGARIEAGRASEYYRKLGVADRFQFNLHPAGHEFDTPAILAFFDRHL